MKILPWEKYFQQLLFSRHLFFIIVFDIHSPPPKTAKKQKALKDEGYYLTHIKIIFERVLSKRMNINIKNTLKFANTGKAYLV